MSECMYTCLFVIVTAMRFVSSSSPLTQVELIKAVPRRSGRTAQHIYMPLTRIASPVV